MDKKRILFVDDEQNILDGLRRMLRSLRNEYEMHFACSGREALEIMATLRFDVVVSDMRMPGMDGAELLGTLQKQYPHTIRIMLTGQADEESILRTVGVVHQFLAKPCDPEILKMVLLQTSALQDMLSDGGLKNLISQIGTLPSLPSTYAKLRQAIASPHVDISEISAIVEQDIAMSANILHLVNSAFFGLYSRVHSPGRAVQLLGLETLKTLVLGVEIFTQLKVPKELIQINKLWAHSLAIGNMAKAVAGEESSDKDLINNSFIAGILHDVGRLILVSQLPEQYLQVVELTKDPDIPIQTAEKAVFGTSQSVVGSYLMGLWGFTGPVIEAIGFHYMLDKYPANSFTPALAVHIANVFYYRHHPEEIIGRYPELHLPSLERLGLQQKIAVWEKICSPIVLLDLEESI